MSLNIQFDTLNEGQSIVLLVHGILIQGTVGKSEDGDVLVLMHATMAESGASTIYVRRDAVQAIAFRDRPSTLLG